MSEEQAPPPTADVTDEIDASLEAWRSADRQYFELRLVSNQPLDEFQIFAVLEATVERYGPNPFKFFSIHGKDIPPKKDLP